MELNSPLEYTEQEYCAKIFNKIINYIVEKGKPNKVFAKDIKKQYVLSYLMDLINVKIERKQELFIDDVIDSFNDEII